MVSKHSLVVGAALPEDAMQVFLVRLGWSKAVHGACPVLLRGGRLLLGALVRNPAKRGLL